ncbi:uncharacterized protein [Macrobrachium rosenbergii]|uniref:uncharacterized protein n=1 Tax=Macrobrachium rosenbergii TaxID=79674 RepID=UPI0034D6D290
MTTTALDKEMDRIHGTEQADQMEADCTITRKRTQEETEDDTGEWITVSNKKKQARRSTLKECNQTSTSTTTVTGRNSTDNMTQGKLIHFRVVADNTTEAFRAVAAFDVHNKNLKYKAKPNMQGQWTLSTNDPKAINTLRTTSQIHLKELKEEERSKKAVVVGYPLEMPESQLTSLKNISSAERMKNKEGILTRTILVTFIGPHPQKVDLGIFGQFWVKKYYPEPLRCYRCQRFGHHKTQCQAKFEICAICSQRHPTQECIDKHKKGVPTTPKCPNCKKGHTAMAWGCPERVARVIAALPKDNKQTRRSPSASGNRPFPKPLTRRRFYTREELEEAKEEVRRESLKTESSSRTCTPNSNMQAPKPLPRTIFIKTTVLRKKLTDLVTKAITGKIEASTIEANIEELMKSFIAKTPKSTPSNSIQETAAITSTQTPHNPTPQPSSSSLNPSPSRPIPKTPLTSSTTPSTSSSNSQVTEEGTGITFAPRDPRQYSSNYQTK